MAGAPTHLGLIPRLMNKLFDGIGESPEQIEFTVKVSYLEIYLEKLRSFGYGEG